MVTTTRADIMEEARLIGECAASVALGKLVVEQHRARKAFGYTAEEARDFNAYTRMFFLARIHKDDNS